VIGGAGVAELHGCGERTLNETDDRGRINTAEGWLRLLFGLILVFSLFHWSAVALRSNRGEAGLLVGAIVIAATIAVERVLFGYPLRRAGGLLGLGVPRGRALGAAAGIACLLFVVVYLFVQRAGTSFALLPGSAALLPGLFAQAGLAEETLFRGYLFGHLRRGRSFWQAATVSMLPFALVHVSLFFTMPWPLAAASLLLAVAISFPLAHLFELGAGTVWAPALLHFVIQGTVKLIVLSNGDTTVFPLVWMAASTLLPLLALLVQRPPSEPPRPVASMRA
jgi:membrane protease YdiL (CAAX protease family)